MTTWIELKVPHFEIESKKVERILQTKHFHLISSHKDESSTFLSMHNLKPRYY